MCKFFHVFFLSSINTDRRPMPRNEFLAEIPPDPTNFLREDGDDTAKAEPGQTPRPQNNRNRNNNNRNRSDRPRPDRSSKDGDTVSGDSPNRPRNQRPRPQQPQNRSPQDPNAPVKRPTPPSQLRNERRSAPAPEGEQHNQRSPTGPPNQSQPNRQRRPNSNRQPNKEGGVDRNNITVQISEGEVRSVKCKFREGFA